MEIYKIYFQRLSYDGENYTKGEFLDPQVEWGLYCRGISLAPMREMKDYTSQDWPGMDGQDVYVPGEISGSAKPRRKSFDMEISFIWEGPDSDWERVRGAVIDYMSGGRLCYYDEYCQTGRKDMVMKNFDHEILHRNSTEGVTIMCLKISYTVYDPVTDVLCETETGDDDVVTITGLTWND